MYGHFYFNIEPTESFWDTCSSDFNQSKFIKDTMKARFW